MIFDRLSGVDRERVLQPHDVEFGAQVALFDDRGEIGGRLQQFGMRFDRLGRPGRGFGHLGKPLVFELPFDFEALRLKASADETPPRRR